MMFFKLSNKKRINQILVVSLTNIGDIIAISPSMDVLLNDFPDAKVSVIVGPKGQTLFDQNSNIDRVYVYDKHAPFSKKLKWWAELRVRKFDAVIDFRNSLLPFILHASTRTPPELFMPKNLHLVDKHLRRLKSIYPFKDKSSVRKAIVILPADRVYVDSLLSGFVKNNERFVLVAPVAADSAKTWSPEGFAKVCDTLIERYGVKVVMVGGEENLPVMQAIRERMSHPFLALAGRTNLVQVAELVNRACFSIVHDSGIMHLGSYFNRQVLALFGPTDPRLSGPWSENSGYIWKNQGCPRCEEPKAGQRHSCMSHISAEDVLSCIEIFQTKVVLRTIKSR